MNQKQEEYLKRKVRAITAQIALLNKEQGKAQRPGFIKL